MTATLRQSPVKGCLKIDAGGDFSNSGKKVFFDEIMIKEYPVILGDNPAVSSGAPITIGWKSCNESVIDLDFYEYCRIPERKPRKKMILSVRRRANTLLSSGYSIEQIANATLEVERTKKLRADSLRSAGWINPWELLSGAVETTGTALKRVDVLGVGAAAGMVVGAGQAAGSVVQGVVGAGADITVQTGRMLVSGVQSSSRAVTEAGRAVAKPMVGAGKHLVVRPVGKVVTTTGKVVSTGVASTGKAIGTGITTTGRVVGTVVTSTGRALVNMVSPSSASADPSKEKASKDKEANPRQTKRRTSFLGGKGSTHERKEQNAIDVQ